VLCSRHSPQQEVTPVTGILGWIWSSAAAAAAALVEMLCVQLPLQLLPAKEQFLVCGYMTRSTIMR
jgi:hypothetical protein